jgi:hypothetical protein
MGCDRLHSKSRQPALQARKIDYVKHSHKRLFSVAAEGAFYLSNIVAAAFVPIQLFRNSAFVLEIFSEIREEN